jgi:hypothetical protein
MSFVDPLLGAAVSYGAGRALTAGARGMYGIGKRVFSSTGEPAKRRRTLNQQIRANQRALYISRNRRTGGLIDIEKKFFDSSTNGVSLTPGSWVDLPPGNSITCPAQGDGAQERDGRVFWIHSIHGKGYVHVPADISASAPEDILVRIVVVWDTQCNNAAVTPSEIYETVARLSNRLRNLEHSSRYIVLKDKLIRVNRNVYFNTTAAQPHATEQFIPFKFNKSFKKPIKVRCSGTTASVASLTDNSITVLGGLNLNSPAVNIQMESRCRFQG